MYCNKCGKPMQPDYRGICLACIVREYNKNTSFSEFADNLRQATKAQKKKENKMRILVIIAGFFCPLIWIIYCLSKKWSSGEKWATSSSSISYSGGSSSYSGGGSISSSSSFDDSSSEKKFGFTGGDGNIYESGGLFCDWAGEHLEWGSLFHDSRGNLVAWGQPFYDNRDNYTTWGSPFYDAGDNYINPRS